MRRFSTTMIAAVAAVALLGASPMVWASGPGGGTSGGGTSGGGSGGGGGTGGGSANPCMQISVAASPKIALGRVRRIKP